MTNVSRFPAQQPSQPLPKHLVPPGKQVTKLRPVPIDTLAEKALIACCIAHPPNMYEVAGHIQPQDFDTDEHKIIWETLLDLHDHNSKITPITVQSALQRSNKLAAAGGVAAIHGLFVDGLGSVKEVDHYASRVRDCADKRWLISTAGQIAALGYEDQEDFRELHGMAMSLLESRQPQHQEIATLHDARRKVLDELDTDEQRCFSTGFIVLDAILNGGLYPSDLIICAGRPGMGKSSIALQIAMAASWAELQSLYFTIEMSREQLAQRSLSYEARINAGSIRRKTLSDDDSLLLLEKFGEGEAAAKRIHLSEDGQADIDTIKSACRLYKRREDISLVVLDHLQLIENVRKSRTDNRNQEVAGITRSLKMLARELDITILCLSQMSRAIENRADHIPQLSDLRESGAIEADADIVWFVHRPEVYAKTELDRQDMAGLAEIHVAKQRSGDTGQVDLRWLGEYTCFEEG